MSSCLSKGSKTEYISIGRSHSESQRSCGCKRLKFELVCQPSVCTSVLVCIAFARSRPASLRAPFAPPWLPTLPPLCSPPRRCTVFPLPFVARSRWDVARIRRQRVLKTAPAFLALQLWTATREIRKKSWLKTQPNLITNMSASHLSASAISVSLLISTTERAHSPTVFSKSPVPSLCVT